jgi:hypothetical protein
MTFFSGMYKMGCLIQLHSFHTPGLSPSETAFEWLILLRAALRCVLMKRALQKLLGALFTGITDLCLCKRYLEALCKLSFIWGGCRAGGCNGVEGKCRLQDKDVT